MEKETKKDEFVFSDMQQDPKLAEKYRSRFRQHVKDAIVDGPAFCMPIDPQDDKVIIPPGIAVSERTINSVTPNDNLSPSRLNERIESFYSELRQDLDASRAVVKAMEERQREKFDPNEQYVSFDKMPPPLQRVVKAYAALSEAQQELHEAVTALGLSTPTSK